MQPISPFTFIYHFDKQAIDTPFWHTPTHKHTSDEGTDGSLYDVHPRAWVNTYRGEGVGTYVSILLELFTSEKLQNCCLSDEHTTLFFREAFSGNNWTLLVSKHPPRKRWLKEGGLSSSKLLSVVAGLVFLHNNLDIEPNGFSHWERWEIYQYVKNAVQIEWYIYQVFQRCSKALTDFYPYWDVVFSDIEFTLESSIRRANSVIK